MLPLCANAHESPTPLLPPTPVAPQPPPSEIVPASTVFGNKSGSMVVFPAICALPLFLSSVSVPRVVNADVLTALPSEYAVEPPVTSICP